MNSGIVAWNSLPILIPGSIREEMNNNNPKSPTKYSIHSENYHVYVIPEIILYNV